MNVSKRCGRIENDGARIKLRPFQLSHFGQLFSSIGNGARVDKLLYSFQLIHFKLCTHNGEIMKTGVWPFAVL